MRKNTFLFNLFNEGKMYNKHLLLSVLPTTRHKKLLGFLILAFIASIGLQAQTIRYVKAGATGDGSSWTNASGDLQVINDNSAVGDQIWVAAGTYTPLYDKFGNNNPSDPKKRIFKIKDGVKLYGGFSGTESSLSQRNFKTNVSILSGDFNNDDVLNSAGTIGSGQGNNAEYVLYADGSTGVTIDGFSITGASNGGGMSIENGQNVIANNLIYNNYANNGGAGIYAANGTHLILNNVIYHNVAIGSNRYGNGAGIFMYNTNNSKVINNVIYSNYASNNGGGVNLQEGSNLQMMNNTLYGNNAFAGGGLFIYKKNNNLWNFYGNVFSENQSEGNSNERSADYWEYNEPFGNPADLNNNGWYNFTNRFENNHFQLGSDQYYAGEQLPGSGAALFNRYYGNNANFGPGNIFAQSQLFKNSNNPAGADNILRTADDGLGLVSCSALINKGNSIVMSHFGLDITGQNRSQLSAVDIGAYENGIVEPVPDIKWLLGGGRICTNSTGKSLRIDLSQSGVNYQLKTSNGDNVGSAISGTGGTITFPAQLVGSYYAVASTTNGCTVNMNGTDGTDYTSYHLTKIYSHDIFPSIAFTNGPTLFCVGSASSYTAALSSTYSGTYSIEYSIDKNIGASINPTTGVVSNVTGNFAVVATATSECGEISTATRSVIVNVLANANVVQGQNIRYVKQGGTGNGASWATASGNLQAVINNSNSGDQVWVAAGTYTPSYDKFGNCSPQDDKNRLFKIKDGVKIYGGFAGTESSLSQRNFKTNKTILSADIYQDDVLNSAGRIVEGKSNNVYYVVYAEGTTGVTIDGFSITGAYNGGGVSIQYGQNVISNNLIYNNLTQYGGAGIFAGEGTFLIINNIIHHNAAYGSNGWGIGAGIDMYKSVNSKIINNVITANDCNNAGAGLYLDQGSNLQMMNNTIVGNNAETGGGLYIYKKDNNIWNFYGNIFSGNTGGANDDGRSSDYWEYNQQFNGSLNDGWHNFTNHFENNHFQLSPDKYYRGVRIGSALFNQFAGNNADFGQGNLFEQDIKFKNSGDDPLELSSCSPLINKGSSHILSSYNLDITGQNRNQLGSVDMGAYESPLVESLPAVYNVVSAGGSFCNGAGGIEIGLSGSQLGVTYYLYYKNNSYVDVYVSQVTGTGGRISFGLHTNEVTYKVKASTTAGACSAGWMQGEISISNNFCCDDYPTDILYVNAAVSGGDGKGSSWANAFSKLSDALYVTKKCGARVIKVAAGVYREAINVPNDVTLEGGYNAATGNRDISANVTVLSGDLNNDDVISGSGSTLSITNNSENAVDVVNLGNNTSIDGFSITGGKGVGVFANYGARGSTISNNIVYGNGQNGINVNDGLITITKNVICRNGGATSYKGGGINIYIRGDINIWNNTIYGNAAVNGGGIYAIGSNYNIVYNIFCKNNTIYDNFATTGGGICANVWDQYSKINFYCENNTIYNNSATDGGGAYLFNQSSTSYFICNNSTFYNNSANEGGGVFMDNGAYFANTIFWGNKKGNSTTTDGADINTGSTCYVQNSLLQVYSAGTNCIVGQDPRFVDVSNPVGSDGIHRTADDGLALQAASPAINSPYIYGTRTDITGRDIVDARDMGAYEWFNACKPFAYTLTGGTYCEGSTGFEIGLSGSENGVVYQLKKGANNVGAVVSGTGTAISFAPQTSGIYFVEATKLSTTCTATMLNTVVVKSKTAPSIAGFNVSNNCGNSELSIPLAPAKKALAFDGVDDYINLGNLQQFNWTKELTIEAMVKISDYSGNRALFSLVNPYYLNSISNDAIFTVEIDAGGKLLVDTPFEWSNNSVEHYYTKTSSAFPLYKWTHLAIVCNENIYPNIKIYIDGIEAPLESAVNVGVLRYNNASFIIGQNDYKFGTNRFKGSMDAVRIWNRALSTQEIISPMNTTGLIAEYEFEEANGSNTAANSAVNSNTGTLYNFNTATARQDLTSNLWSTGATSNSITVVNPGIYTVVASHVNGCSVSASATVSPNPLPIAYNVISTGTYCQGSSGAAVGLTNSETGVSYQLKKGTTNIGTAVNGTGAAISFGNQTVGTYTVVATKTTSGCTATMTGSASVTEVFPPTVNFSVGTTCSNSVLTANATQQKYALSFDGVDDYVDCGNNSMAQLSGNAITLEAWIYPTSWKQYVHEGSVINKEFNENGNDRGYMLRVGEGGKINFNLGNGSWNEVTTSTSVLSLNTWQHIAATYDGTTMRIFVNGNQVASQNRANINFLNSSANLRIGNWSGDPKRCFSGYIGEVRIWSVVRTQTEIQNAQNSTVASSSTGLRAYYKMDENTGTSTIDATGNGSTGTLINGTSWINSTSPIARPLTYLWSNSLTTSSITVSNAATYTVTVTNDNGCTVSADVNAPPLSLTLDVSVATTCSNSVLTANATQQKYALSFDGVDDYVDCGNNSMVQLSGNAITLEAWIYPTSWKQYVHEGSIINKEFNENGNDRGYMLRVGEEGKINFNLGNGSWNEVTTSTSVLSLNTWQHIAATYDGTTMRIFVNGNQVASQNRANINFLNSSANLRIGNWSGDPKRCFPGYIDEVRIWSVARTQTQIQNAQNSSVASNSMGLRAYYKMEENIGTSTVDATGNDSTGTLVNGTSWITSTSPIVTPFTYLWSNSSTTTSITVSDSGTYTVTVTNDNGCTISANGIVALTSIANFNVIGGGILCSNNDGGLSIGLSNSVTGATYQLKKNGNNVGSPIAGTGAALAFGNFFDAGTYTVVATNAQGCTVTMTGNAVITLSTLSESYTVTGGGTYCAGLDGVEVGLSGSQTGVSYQLKKDNANVGTPIMGTGAAISFGKQTAAGTYTVNATLLVGACIIIFQNSVTVTIDETLPAFDPYFTPSDNTISCNDVIPGAPTVIASNDCSSVTMTEVSTKGTNPNECSFYDYAITRTWTATDKRGNTATVSQVITITNKIAPTFGTVNDVTVTEHLIPTTVPFTLNSCGTPATLSLTETRQDLTPLACQTYHYVLNRVWTVTDICGNTSTKTQKITARGVKLTCPSNKDLNTNTDAKNDYNCSTLVSSSLGVAPQFLDNCNQNGLSYAVTGATTLSGNGSVAGLTFNRGVSVVTYTLKSASFTEKCSYNINVIDNELPKITTPALSVIDACDFPSTLPSNFTPTTSDNCIGALNLEVVSDVTANVTGCSSKSATLKYTKSLTRTWKVTDASGNTATRTQLIYIRDMQAPTAVAKTVEVFIGNTTLSLAASAFNLSSSDNCTPSANLSFRACVGATCTSLSSSLSLAKNLIPAGQTQATIPVSFQAWDACSNKSTTVQTSVILRRVGSLGDNASSKIKEIEVADNEVITPKEESGVDATHGSLKCYPNPFAEDLNLEYNLTQDVENLIIKVYDNQGRLVEKNERGAAAAGFYQMRWNLSNLTSGMYHICLELDGKCTKVERVILMK